MLLVSVIYHFYFLLIFIILLTIIAIITFTEVTFPNELLGTVCVPAGRTKAFKLIISPRRTINQLMLKKQVSE